MENRNGLIIKTAVTPATGTGEREAAKRMIQKLPRTSQRITLGCDKGYDTKDFVKAMRELNVTPHVAQNNSNRRSAIDGRTQVFWATPSAKGSGSESKRALAG